MALICCSGLLPETVTPKRTTGLEASPLITGNDGECVTACIGSTGCSALLFLQLIMLNPISINKFNLIDFTVFISVCFELLQ